MYCTKVKRPFGEILGTLILTVEDADVIIAEPTPGIVIDPA